MRSSISGVGDLVLEYRLKTGILRSSSYPSVDSIILSCSVKKIPCWGENRTLRELGKSEFSTNFECVRELSNEALLHRSPSLLPLSIYLPSSFNTSIPVRTFVIQYYLIILFIISSNRGSEYLNFSTMGLSLSDNLLYPHLHLTSVFFTPSLLK